MISLHTSELKQVAPTLKPNDRVSLSGTVYTARDAAHKRLAALIKEGKPLPFDLNGAVIYYAGPTETPPDMIIGSCGPTTSSRMDVYTPLLFQHGLAACIGKGPRSNEVTEAIQLHGGLYLCAIGGAGALAAICVTANETVAFPELGCEAVRKLTVKDLSLIVSIC
ncbi:MAG: FumA C-terminus/TtdB family hydratase beta subunit [Oscillospiraceae bacterium]|jgi:fumarate hydratase subunit beta|nr:FumA C-terminus/TtdB family hydratase beta subunit [Oscillospiraceae bacterium]